MHLQFSHHRKGAPVPATTRFGASRSNAPGGATASGSTPVRTNKAPTVWLTSKPQRVPEEKRGALAQPPLSSPPLSSPFRVTQSPPGGLPFFASVPNSTQPRDHQSQFSHHRGGRQGAPVPATTSATPAKAVPPNNAPSKGSKAEPPTNETTERQSEAPRKEVNAPVLNDGAEALLTAKISTQLSVPGVSTCTCEKGMQIYIADQDGRTVLPEHLDKTGKYGKAGDMRAELLLDGDAFPDGAMHGKVHCDKDGRRVFCKYGENALDMKARKYYLLVEGPREQGHPWTAVPLEGGNDPSTAVWRDSRPARLLLPKPRESHHFGQVLRLQNNLIVYRCRSANGEECFALVPEEMRCADVDIALRRLRVLMRTAYAPPKTPGDWKRHAKYFVLHVLRKLPAGARLSGDKTLEQMENLLTEAERGLVDLCVAEWDPEPTTQPQLEQPGNDAEYPAGDAEDEVETGKREKKEGDVDVTARGLTSAFERCPTAADQPQPVSPPGQGDAPYNPPSSGTGGVEMVVDEEEDPASPGAPRQRGRLIADAEQQRWHNLRYHNGEQTECYLYIGVGMEGGPELRASQWSCGMNQ